MKERSIVFRIVVVLSTTLLMDGCTWESSGLKDTTKPNIILILADDLGKEWLSCYGAEDIITPNIDALSVGGILFNHAYSMPQCTPSRVTLLTGQYPFRHGWVNHWDVPRWGGGVHFDENLNPSLGRAMKQAGYVTAAAGKWQIDDFRVEEDAMKRNGFDNWCMWTGFEQGVEASANRYHDPYIFTPDGSRTREGDFGPDLFRDFIVDFIHTHKDSSMFIYYPMVLTHTPFVNPPGDSAIENLDKHRAMVRYADRITGDIVRALDECGLREKTLIIWTADNGTARQITGRYRGMEIQGGKSSTQEPGICMPFIVNWPGRIQTGRKSDALVDFSDLFPTCLDLAGVEVGDRWSVGKEHHVIDGRSFKDVLLNDTIGSVRSWILGMGGGNNARLTHAGVENQFLFRDRVVRNERYKLYIGANREPEGFYDLLKDPLEVRNLLDSLHSTEMEENFKKLLQIISTFPERDNDPRYIPNPPQAWDVEISAESQVWKK